MAQGESPSIVLEGPQGSSLRVYKNGAHVASWNVSPTEEILFISKQAIFKPPKAIRGGVPVCFPQFGTLGPLGQHGFARNSMFEVTEQTHDTVVLQFEPSQEELQKFPHPFRLTVTVHIGINSLYQELNVQNTGEKSFEFTTALHTYFQVSGIEKVHVKGLKGLKYFDNVDGADGKLETEELVTVNGETDRVYRDANDTILIEDSGNKRQIKIEKRGLPDAVLWNPWIAKSKGMSDFGDEEYKATRYFALTQADSIKAFT